MSTKYQLGRQGEAAAAKFLTTNGYQILERNYRYLKAKVDIIAIKNNSLVAIEIKTRSSDFFWRSRNISQTPTATTNCWSN
jgi:putative endonuclease